MMQPARNGVILRDHALAFGCCEHRGAEAFGELHELRRRAAPVDAQARDQDRTFRLAQHIQRRLEIGAVGTGHDPIRHQRRFGVVVTRLARGLALRKFEMHRPRRGPGCRAHGAAHLLAHGLGVDGRAPLHDRLVNRQLVDALAQPGLVSGAGIGIGDRDQRRAVEKRVRHAIDHVGGARSARRETNPRTAGEIAPGRGQHGAGDFLFHQEKTHLPLTRRFHQFNRLAARVTDDERRAGILESCGQHFDGCGHCGFSRSVREVR